MASEISIQLEVLFANDDLSPMARIAGFWLSQGPLTLQELSSKLNRSINLTQTHISELLKAGLILEKTAESVETPAPQLCKKHPIPVKPAKVDLVQLCKKHPIPRKPAPEQLCQKLQDQLAENQFCKKHPILKKAKILQNCPELSCATAFPQALSQSLPSSTERVARGTVLFIDRNTPEGSIEICKQSSNSDNTRSSNSNNASISDTLSSNRTYILKDYINKNLTRAIHTGDGSRANKIQYPVPVPGANEFGKRRQNLPKSDQVQQTTKHPILRKSNQQDQHGSVKQAIQETTQIAKSPVKAKSKSCSSANSRYSELDSNHNFEESNSSSNFSGMGRHQQIDKSSNSKSSCRAIDSQTLSSDDGFRVQVNGSSSKIPYTKKTPELGWPDLDKPGGISGDTITLYREMLAARAQQSGREEVWEGIVRSPTTRRNCAHIDVDGLGPIEVDLGEGENSRVSGPTIEERDLAILETIDRAYPPEQAAALRARFKPRRPSDGRLRASAHMAPPIDMDGPELADYLQRALGVAGWNFPCPDEGTDEGTDASARLEDSLEPMANSSRYYPPARKVDRCAEVLRELKAIHARYRIPESQQRLLSGKRKTPVPRKLV